MKWLRKLFCLLIGVLTLTTQASAQDLTVTGQILDSTDTPVSNATIILYNSKTDSVQTVSDGAGRFRFTHIANSQFKLKIGHIAFESYTGEFVFPTDRQSIQLRPVRLIQKTKTLDKLIVTAKTPAISMRQDTIEYLADSFAVKKDGNVEQLLRKLPGLTVNKDGTVIAHGKVVSRITVNGKDFFDGNSRTVTRNLPANIVDKVQVVDDYGESGAWSGMKTGEAGKSINIVLKKDKNGGIFSKLEAGAGSQGVHEIEASTNYFRSQRQFSAFINSNNTNQDNLNRLLSTPFSGSLSSLVKTNNQIVDRLGGTTSTMSLLNNQDIGFVNSIPNYANGVTNSNTAGARYADAFGRLSVYGSYMYSGIANDLFYRSSGREYFPEAVLDAGKQYANDLKYHAHRIFANLNYQADSGFVIKLIPVIDLTYTRQKENESDALRYRSKLLDTSALANASASNVNTISLDLIVKKKLNQSRVSIYFETRYRSVNNNDTLNGSYFFYPLSEGLTYQKSATHTKTRVIDPKGSFAYRFNRSWLIEANLEYNLQTDNYRRNLSYLQNGAYATDTAYSGSIWSTNSIGTAGVNVKHSNRHNDWLAGLAVQTNGYERRDSATVREKTTSLVPSLQWLYAFSRTQQLSVRYSGTYAPPAPLSLFPLADTTNPTHIIRGNPSLKPSFKNYFSVNYYDMDVIKGRIFMANLLYTKTYNDIVQELSLDSAGRTIISFVNTDHSNEFSGYYNLSIPFANKKYEITLSGKLATRSYLYMNGGIATNVQTVTSNEKLEFALNTDLIESKIGASLRSQAFNIGPFTEKAYVYGAMQQTDLFLKHSTIGYDLQFLGNDGYLVNTKHKTVWLLNAYVQQELSTKISLRLSCSDALGQARYNAFRVLDINYMHDYSYNVIGRYLLISIRYKFSRFGL